MLYITLNSCRVRILQQKANEIYLGLDATALPSLQLVLCDLKALQDTRVR